MPVSFERCVQQGGRVRTVKPSATTYLPVCYKNGHSYAGHVKHDRAPRAHHKGSMRSVVAKVARRR